MRRSSIIGKYPIIEVLGIMLVTAVVSFWNPFSRFVNELYTLFATQLILLLPIRMGLSEFAAQLFSECSPTNNNGGLCA